MSSLWSTFTAATQPRAGIPLVIPSFTYTGQVWLGTSRELHEIDFSLTDPFTLDYPIIPEDDWTFVLAIRLADGTRYKLTEHPDDDLHYPMYNGEIINEDFSIEVWSTNNSDASLAEDLELPTNNTENIIGCCEDLTPTTYDGTLDEEIFAMTDTDSGDEDIILVFGTPTTPPPATGTYVNYYGKLSVTSPTGGQVATLSSFTEADVARTYAFSSGAGYAYFCCPDTETPPTAMTVSGFDLVLAGTAQGYSSIANGLRYRTVTVGSTTYKVYRSYYQLHGSFNLVVT